MGNLFGKLAFAFLIILSTLGMAAYIIQNQYGEAITFVEFFEMIRNK